MQSHTLTDAELKVIPQRQKCKPYRQRGNISKQTLKYVAQKREGGRKAVVYYFVFERKTYGGTVRLIWEQRNWEGQFPIREAEVVPRSLEGRKSCKNNN